MDLTDTFFNWPVFKGAFPLLLEGLGVTVLLGLVSIVSGLVSGLLMALLRLYGPPPLRMLARVYIDVFRSIPLLVLLLWMLACDVALATPPGWPGLTCGARAGVISFARSSR